METNQSAIYRAAEAHMGLDEWPGAKHNPAIVKMFEASGHGWVKDDETPWCAAFVGSVLAECGLQGTGDLAARSYMKWGEAVDPAAAKPGDIVVFWRGSKDGWQGHVAFFDKFEGDDVWVLGGNQGNTVSVARYPRARLLGVRRPSSPRAKPVQSKTVQASTVGAATTVAGGVTAIGALDGTAQLAVIVLLGVSLIAFGLIFRERLKAWAAGWR